MQGERYMVPAAFGPSGSPASDVVGYLVNPLGAASGLLGSPASTVIAAVCVYLASLHKYIHIHLHIRIYSHSLEMSSQAQISRNIIC